MQKTPRWTLRARSRDEDALVRIRKTPNASVAGGRLG